jgi:formate hydrogenlyase transcriptional activator
LNIKLIENISVKLLLDSMPGMIYMFDRKGFLVAWNKKVEEVYEYSSDELEGMHILDFIDSTDRSNVEEKVNNVFESGYDMVENLALTKSGKQIPYIGSGKKIRIDGEDYMVGFSTDISELYAARQKIIELNEILEAENVYLKDQLKQSGSRFEIIGDSDAVKYALFRVEQVAPTDASVLIQGETGTGKELIARAIHKESKRSDSPFVKVNCASIPEHLIESELFGHEKGAFTGAIQKRIGRFEMANGGTIFLDEIGELPLTLQPKLLHVLQQGEFERIGSSKTIKTDVRVISATNKVLEEEITKGLFRSDLYYRLNVYPITLAPLRERNDDIIKLAEYYIKHYSEKFNKPIKAISKISLKKLLDYSWPGNVRELGNVIERSIITSNSKILNISDLTNVVTVNNDNLSLEEIEKHYILSVMEKTSWKIFGENGAASVLKINPETLRSKIRKLGIRRINI